MTAQLVVENIKPFEHVDKIKDAEGMFAVYGAESIGIVFKDNDPRVDIIGTNIVLKTLERDENILVGDIFTNDGTITSQLLAINVRSYTGKPLDYSTVMTNTLAYEVDKIEFMNISLKEH